jgi:hypothetical protein
MHKLRSIAWLQLQLQHSIPGRVFDGYLAAFRSGQASKPSGSHTIPP